MEKSHILALIIAYYLSRFDRAAVQNLGFKTFNKACKTIAEKLEVKATTLKNMRDEFDPHFQNTRVGWYQRELRGSRKKAMQALQNLDEVSLREIVLDILNDNEFIKTSNFDVIASSVIETEKNKLEKSNIFVFRGPTGKKAEEYFIGQFNKGKTPFKGKLKDTRDAGCGYDFEITNGAETLFIEVKGLTKNDGGISFTNKELETAKIKNDLYYLVVVSNLGDIADIGFIKNPTTILKTRKSVYTTVNIAWNVSQKEIKNALYH